MALLTCSVNTSSRTVVPFIFYKRFYSNFFFYYWGKKCINLQPYFKQPITDYANQLVLSIFFSFVFGFLFVLLIVLSWQLVMKGWQKGVCQIFDKKKKKSSLEPIQHVYDADAH